ncbi:MAG: hypothetical protein ACT4PZ_02595 [Panacagrimonas sp.]
MNRTRLVAAAVSIALIAFFAGYYVPQRETESACVYAVKNAEYQMALRVFKDMRGTYGGVRFDAPEYQNVVGTVHLFKDMDFAVYQDGPVKTIRVYEP